MEITAVWVTLSVGHTLFSVNYKPTQIDDTLFGALLATWNLNEGEFYTSAYANAKLGIKKSGSLIFVVSFGNLPDTEVKSLINKIEAAFLQQYSNINFADHMSVFVLSDDYFTNFKKTVQNIIFEENVTPDTYEAPPVNYDHPVLRNVVVQMLNKVITPQEAKEKFIEVLGELPSAEEVRRIVNTVKGFMAEEEAKHSNFITEISEKMATWGEKAKIFVFGIDFAGKTAIANRFKGMGDEALETTSTVRQSVTQVVKQNLILTSWEGAGQKSYRALWPEFLRNSNGLMFVIDGSDPDRFDEAKEEFYKLLASDKENLPLAICVNKSDLENFIGSAFIIEFLDVEAKLTERSWEYFNTSAVTGEGLAEALDWLVEEIIKNLESFFT
ncbi:MAG: ADP-ribosylation factor family protein [Candidatus Hermodarchaeota archaeon]